MAGLIPIDLRIWERMAQYSTRRNTALSRLTITDLQDAQVSDIASEHYLTYSQLPHPSQQIIIGPPPDDHTQSVRHISIYTDGSKGEGVGAAFTVSDESTSPCYNNISQLFRLDNSCTVYQAECLAIREALRWISTLTHFPDRVIIHSDSQSAIASLRNSSNRNPIVRETLTIAASIDIPVYVDWVKGHSGVAGNERADELAREAATSTLPICYDRIPRSLTRSTRQ